MNTDELQGKELDALAAQEIMSWTLSADGYEWLGTDGRRAAGARFVRIGGNDDILRFSPSVNIADAWRVWDKLPSQIDGKEVIWSIAHIWRNSVKFAHIAYLVTAKSGDAVLSSAHGELPGVAICRAGLKAIRHNANV